MMTKQSRTTKEIEEAKERLNAYHRKWQNEKYAHNKEFREMKKRNAVAWKLKHLERYRAYHDAYQKRVRAAKKEEGRGSGKGK